MGNDQGVRVLSADELAPERIEKLEKMVKAALGGDFGNGPLYRVAYMMATHQMGDIAIESVLKGVVKQARRGYVEAGKVSKAPALPVLPEDDDQGLYYGVAVSLATVRLKTAIGNAVTKRSRARFWYRSAVTPAMCWIVFWPSTGAEPFPAYVPYEYVRISEDHVNPPEMPGWAREGGRARSQ